MVRDSATTVEARKALIASDDVLDIRSPPGVALLEWLDLRSRNAEFRVESVPLSDLRAWHFDDGRNLVHESGAYFRITGLVVPGTDKGARGWNQPIIDQPEVGILAILAQRNNDEWRYLLAAKAEPGNIGRTQLAPTVQATFSNYSRVHGGALPPYVDWVLDRGVGRRVVDVLQPEQASRFLHKHNRNVIIEVPERCEISIVDGFRWCSSAEVAAALHADNIVNAEARSVLACLPPDWLEPADGFAGVVAQSWFQRRMPCTDASIPRWLACVAATAPPPAVTCPLGELHEWVVGPDTIESVNGPFRVIGVRCRLGAREVRTWDQPILDTACSGLIGLAVRVVDGAAELLVQSRADAGIPGSVQVGPTIQTSRNVDHGSFADLLLGAPADRILCDTMQSEEGGRFFAETHRHLVVDVTEVDAEPPVGLRWLGLRQVHDLLMQGRVNSQLRSLLALLLLR